ncbi:SDR family NAD(P)-dependent oxidoreductase [Sphingomonas sp. ID0503]|uniref:SDR family NAD(P)-dependent oxidoreductase n=1 Tax=Sphingomonas sp. ID0503 TaxID=3399691 RepID=UPI003AFAE7CA
MSRLANKIAIVTGGASGIGRACAMRMAADGAIITIADINDEGAETVADEIRQAGGQAHTVRCDITEEDSIRAAIQSVASKHGRLDILHNNAAYTPLAVLEEDVDILTISTESWDKVMQGTLRGTMLGCRYGVLEMLKNGGGSIINTSSMYGVGAFNRQPAYGVSKAAINMLTEYVATAFGKQGIRCNAVAPSMISTPLLRGFIPEPLVKLNEDATLTPFLGEPEDIAAIVAFLASDDARYLTGQVIRADGGTTAHLPTYSDARRFFGEA